MALTRTAGPLSRRAAAARSGRGAPVPAHMLPLLRCCLDCLAAIPVKTLRLVAAERSVSCGVRVES